MPPVLPEWSRGGSVGSANSDSARRPSGQNGGGEVSYPDDGNDLTLKVEDASFWFHHRNKVLELMLGRFKPVGTLWDIGGGNGFQALHFQKQGHPVVMVEPGPGGCRNARARGVEHVVQGTLESLKLPSGKIAATSAFDVIEHLEHPQELLREASRVMKPGGRMYLTVPAYQSLWSDEDLYACHHRRYTADSLELELGLAGFQVEFLSYYFQFLVLPIFMLRSLPYRAQFWKKYDTAAMDLEEHTPGKASAAVANVLLERELAALHSGKRLRFGSSLIAVATRRS